VVKRTFDLLISGIALAVLLPVFAVLAIWIRIDSPGPVMFRQERVGRFGVPFRIHKFRTMYWNRPKQGPSLTVGDDVRITRCGRFLRRAKLDELPQLLDVFLGDMSIVGPRPEVPGYVAHWSEQDRRVILSVRPGITDLASIRFRNESEILKHSSDPEHTYLHEILPVKLCLYRDYVERRSMVLDLQVLMQTVFAVLFDKGVAPPREGLPDSLARTAPQMTADADDRNATRTKTTPQP